MHFDQTLIFIIVAAVIGISRLVARIAEKTREQSQRRNKQAQAQTPTQQQSQPPMIFTRPKTDEERVREFLEALGVPAGTIPPAKVQPRTDLPPRPVAPVSPPPLGPFPPVIPRKIAQKARRVFTPSPAPSPVPDISSETAGPGTWLREEEKIEAAATKFEISTRAISDENASLREGTDAGLRNALRSRQSIRTAVILREILGPPLALRDL